LGKPFQTPGVIFSPNDAVIPDVVWVSNLQLENGIDSAGHLTAPPEVMVEVLSPGELNKQRDQELKLKLYSRYGIQEYWIVSWQLKTLDVYRLESEELQLTDSLTADKVLTSLQLPDFRLPIHEIFQ